MKKMLSSLLIIILFSCDQSYESVNPIPSNRQKIWQVSKIKDYQSKEGLQNEKGLERYIDQILTDKANKK